MTAAHSATPAPAHRPAIGCTTIASELSRFPRRVSIWTRLLMLPSSASTPDSRPLPPVSSSRPLSSDLVGARSGVYVSQVVLERRHIQADLRTGVTCPYPVGHN